ncbi:ArnT family glycosyltransferase [Hyphococcus sp.]|uniref:ArnT family glycosyltransferase n=1 Tax=Hyphococcus sp. TaxID=2038636 RepID=UPI00207FEB0D|nr:MAG: hypothetical protein DHS20C04_11010 [Marinicaulis sp.]
MSTVTTHIRAQAPLWRNFWVIAVALIALRVLTLMFTPLGLGPDETQYWYWSRALDFGYFSKPPLIAWAIGLTTALFGNAEWAARLSAPLFHFGAAAFLYVTAKRLFDDRIALWTGLSWLLMPGVILSSFIMATDAPLLFFWSAALYFLVRIIDAPSASLADFAGLGSMIGLGMMSKYAMIYFPVAMALCLFIKPLREKLLRPPLLLTVLIALLIFAPNIVWNANHDFQTLSHTAANAHWSEDLIKPLSLLEFLGGQLAVFGVIPFGALIWIVANKQNWKLNEKSLLLLIFSLTPLIIVAAQAFLSRAHANWAAAAYPAASLLVTGMLLQSGKAMWVKISAGFHALVFIGFTCGVLAPTLIDNVGLARAVKDLRGWKTQTGEILSDASGYDAVLIDDRYLMGEMLYHQRGSDIEIAAIDPNASIDNHFEAFRGFDAARMKRNLFVTTRDDARHIDYRFHTIIPVAVVDATPGKGQQRRYRLYEVSDYFGPDGN